MTKIKHIALSTQDVEKTAKFYVETFGMKEVGRVDDPGTRGVFLTDGDINLAVLNFKNDAAAGLERGKDFSGIHHIGFQVESLAAVAEKLTAAGARRRRDVEHALGVGPGTAGNVEVKWTGPDGVMLDVSRTGWLGTPTFGQ
jgi:catechol 2,3-dioxygenase-like lactoylglutathione lyase family enzyme